MAVICAVSFVILFPTAVFAWGPAMHLEYGIGALALASSFLPWIAALIGQYRNDFLYGCIAADITLGKKFVHYNYHCHNWKVALRLFHSVQEEHHKAFMLGYLSHLAADTVSHNYFVPFYSIKSFRMASHRHTFWEICMDVHADPHIIEMGELFKDDYYLRHDRLLEQELRRTLFSFKTNKRIFNTLLALQRMRRYREMSRNWASRSEYSLSLEEAALFKGLCQDAICDLFRHFEGAACLGADPTGRLKILFARETVKGLRRYHRAGRLSKEGEQQLMQDLDAALRQGLFESVVLPQLEDYIV